MCKLPWEAIKCPLHALSYEGGSSIMHSEGDSKESEGEELDREDEALSRPFCGGGAPWEALAAFRRLCLALGGIFTT